MTRPAARQLASAALVLLFYAFFAFFAFGSSGCRKKVSAKQCDELLERFSELVVKERFPDAGPEVVATERARERNEAKSDDAFKNCTSEVQVDEHACAMKAPTPEALIKCLE